MLLKGYPGTLFPSPKGNDPMAELMAFSMASNPSYTPLITALIGANMKLTYLLKFH